MKRAVFLTSTFLLLVALGAVVLAEIPATTGLPAAAQIRLDEYLGYTFPSGTVSVQVWEQAKKPWNFSRNLSQRAFGNSVYYQVDFGPTWTETGNLLPLPYPPRELWCVLLRQEAAGESSNAIVFVAKHSDMYSADWLVHEGAKTLPGADLAGTLQAVGCESTWPGTGWNGGAE